MWNSFISLTLTENWLSATQSLHEQGVNEEAMLCLKQKFFISPASVSLEDPVALHLVYIEVTKAFVSCFCTSAAIITCNLLLTVPRFHFVRQSSMLAR
jgi:hypothetical protein